MKFGPRLRRPRLGPAFVFVFGLSGCAVHPPPRTAFSAGPGLYVVQAGDSETWIAKRLCLSLEQVAAYNPGVDWSHLKIGQKLNYVGPPTPPTPVLYHNPEYDFTFSLSPSWLAYSVLIRPWQGTTDFPATDKTAVTERGTTIILRDPRWTTSAPCQDIPIDVFTRDQWDRLHHGKFNLELYAGGFEGELWHNDKYVFAIHSRYNWNEDLKDWNEADNLVRENCASHPMPRLYPE